MSIVLLTGAAGFIGSHLSERLLANGHRVVAIDSFDPYYDRQIKENNLRRSLSDQNFKFIEGDIRDRSCLQRLFEEHSFDRVVHIAARAGVRPSLENPELYADVNIRGLTLLLEQARLFRVPGVVFASSSSVYGNSPRVPWREDDPAAEPISPYAATKRAGELLSYTYHQVYQLPITCLRFFTVYGPRQRPDMAIHQFAQRILECRPITLFGDGNTERDYTYVDDIVDGVVAATMRCPELGYQIINLGNSHTVALKRLVSLLEAELQATATIEWLPEQPGDVRRTFADISRAANLLDYRPKVGIEEGIRRFIAWMKQQ